MLKKQIWANFQIIIELFTSVADSDPNPDPTDPHVFGPPESGSYSKIVRFQLFCDSFDFLSLKNDVNVASKSNKQKKLC
jgi:hypothetical protein